jgi:glycosyltransferase involved in cell wall biosynthesis
MIVEAKGRLTVLGLCRDNPLELEDSLASLAGQVLPPDWRVELLLIDGSATVACQEVLHRWQPRMERTGMTVRHHRHAPRGIYDALNAGLALSSGAWLQVLTAGDRYADATSLARLLRHAHALAEERRGAPPAAVFGQAWVDPPAGSGVPPWLTPDPAVVRLDCWLRRMVPCHQAFLFRGDFARAHPYEARLGVTADRPVMRAAIRAAGPGAYLRQPVCHFRLGGVSSRQGMAKALLRPWPELTIRLMRRQARWMGWLCSGHLPGSRV